MAGLRGCSRLRHERSVTPESGISVVFVPNIKRSVQRVGVVRCVSPACQKFACIVLALSCGGTLRKNSTSPCYGSHFRPTGSQGRLIRSAFWLSALKDEGSFIVAAAA